MSQITLNQFFDISSISVPANPIKNSSIILPSKEVFVQLPDYPAEKLHNLSHRVKYLKTLQSDLEFAKTRQKRDRIITCIIVSITVGLVAGIVLGVLFCPPLAIVAGCCSTLFAFLLVGVKANISNEKKHNFFDRFWDRKHAPKEIISLKAEIKSDLLEAGKYLQKHIVAIRAKLELDIQNANTVLNQAKQLKAHANVITNLGQYLKYNEAVLSELNDKGQPMLDLMIKKGIITP